MKRAQNYKADLLADLRSDRLYAAEYLSAAFTDSREAFLVALRDVAEARQGVAKLAKAAGVNRESLYRTLSQTGNPRLSTLDSVLDALDISVSFQSKTAQSKLTNTPKPPKRAATGNVSTTAIPNFRMTHTQGFTVTTMTSPLGSQQLSGQGIQVPICLLLGTHTSIRSGDGNAQD